MAGRLCRLRRPDRRRDRTRRTGLAASAHFGICSGSVKKDLQRRANIRAALPYINQKGGTVLPYAVSPASRLLDKAKTAFFDERYTDAENLLRRYLSMPDAVWQQARAEAMLFLAGCRYTAGNLTDTERWLLRACAENPDRPTPWDCLAIFYAETACRNASAK